MADAATFVDATARATRIGENLTADWDTGMNLSLIHISEPTRLC